MKNKDKRKDKFYTEEQQRVKELECLRGRLGDEVIDDAIRTGKTGWQVWQEAAKKTGNAEEKVRADTLMSAGKAMGRHLLENE